MKLVKNSHWLVVSAFMACAIAPNDAFASSSAGVNARTLWVNFDPTDPDVATSVRIQGLIALPGISPQDFSPPVCGYLYYTCKPGEEALCREQWKELATTVRTQQCVLFLARRDQNGNLANVGRVRPFSEAPTSPDVYSAGSGLGVTTLSCGPEFSATCTVPRDGLGGAGGPGGKGGTGAGGTVASTGGAPAAGGTAGGAGGRGGAGAGGTGAGGTVGSTGGVSPNGGSTVGGSGGAGGTPVSTGGAPAAGGTVAGGSGGAGGAPAGIDAATDAPTSTPKGSGCAVAGDGPAAGTGLGAGVLVLTVLLRRRRRQGP